MGEKCQSRYKYVPELPESTRAAQVWHLRYQDVFSQPSVVTILRERAADLAPRRKPAPGRRVQLVDKGMLHEMENGQSNCRPQAFEDRFYHKTTQGKSSNHPDIRAGEALVCKIERGQTTYWAQSKLVSGVDQWRKLADLPEVPPSKGGGKAKKGIMSPRRHADAHARAFGEPLHAGPTASRQWSMSPRQPPPSLTVLDGTCASPMSHGEKLNT